MKTSSLLLLFIFFLNPSFSFNSVDKNLFTEKVELELLLMHLPPCQLVGIEVMNQSLTRGFSNSLYTAKFTVDGTPYWVTYTPQIGGLNTNNPRNMTGGGGTSDF